MSQAAALRKLSPSGSGYLRKPLAVQALRMASKTRGDGGYEHSLVLSLSVAGSLTCSPGA